MKLQRLSKLPFIRSKPSARDQFVDGSLTSSAELDRRLSSWSGNNDRGRPEIMEFHKTWRHPSCPVMKWYGLQNKSSTSFRVIEHRQNDQAPFFHEFLLLRLTDGSVCRVERTREGSRADAVRRIGCTARDIIQWFSNEDYNRLFPKSHSGVLATIDLCREFDIMDVLAVCYSIQNTPMCCVYTLQRYNCYFFCNTVLSVLTRRVAHWENAIGQDAWDSSMHTTLNDTLYPVSEEAKGHILYRLCILLQPGDPDPTGFIANELRAHLTGQPDKLLPTKKAVSNTLWHTVCHSALYYNLLEQLKSVCALIIEHDKVTTAVESVRDETCQKQEIYDQFLLVVNKEFWIQAASNRDFLLDFANKERRMLEMEFPLPFGTRTLCSAAGLLGGLVCAMYPTGIKWLVKDGSLDRSVKLAIATPRPALMMFASVRLQSKLAQVFTGHNGYLDIPKRTFWSFNDSIRSLSLSICNKQLEAAGLFSSLKAVAGVYYSLPKGNLVYSLAHVITAMLAPALGSVLQTHHQPPIQVTYKGSDNVTHETSCIVEFQEGYVYERIRAFANRVASHQLAAADLVVRDMQETISKVWKSMPPGFGSSCE